MYMTPEDAGIMLMDSVGDENEDTGSSKTYSDLSDRQVFKKHWGNNNEEKPYYRYQWSRW